MTELHEPDFEEAKEAIAVRDAALAATNNITPEVAMAGLIGAMADYLCSQWSQASDRRFIVCDAFQTIQAIIEQRIAYDSRKVNLS